MPQRPPDSQDPTSEEEALEFDGTQTDQLDDTYRVRLVASSENGTVAFDDRAQPHWKWITELGPTTLDASGTFDQIKALENPALGLEGDAQPAPEPARTTGYDPYGAPVKPKVRR